MAEREVFVDPAVSRAKFDREVTKFRQLQDEHIRRGWWLLRAEFPEVFVVFGTPQLSPPAVTFGALLDFTDYDLFPPSVRLVDPFTREPYPAKSLPTILKRSVPTAVPPQLASLGLQIQPFQESRLMQWYSPDDVPFLCLAGVREYHEHPAHTGDSWLLHRGSAEGTLHFILNQLYRYGVQPISDYIITPKVTGFRQTQAPE